MKNKIFIIIFIFSIVINLAAIFTIGFHWFADKNWRHPHPPPFREHEEMMHERLNLSDNQLAEIRKSNEMLREQIIHDQIELRHYRDQLIEQIKQSNPDTVVINEMIIKISNIQSEIEKRFIHHMLDQKQILTPEQFERFLTDLERGRSYFRHNFMNKRGKGNFRHFNNKKQK
jgi:Spy/CpxP family protein refolding chaperone